jgi:hypothetical protein
MDVFKSTSAIITYDATNARLIQKWYGYPSSEDFCKAIDASVDFSNLHKVKSILSDTIEQPIINESDAKYAANIMPQLVKNGLKAFAFLVSGKEYTQFAIDYFSSKEKTKLVNHFSNYSEAINWLDKMTR